MAKKEITTETISGTGAPGYEIKVTGEYYSRDPNTDIKSKHYYKPESFIFPKIVKYKDGLKRIEVIVDGKARSKVVPNIVDANALRVGLHLIKNFHIKDRLKEKYPDFVDIRTVEIFSKESTTIDPSKFIDLEKKPIIDMTKSELTQFVTLVDLNITLEGYGDLGDMKIATQRAYDQKKKDDILAGDGEALTEEELLLREPENGIFG